MHSTESPIKEILLATRNSDKVRELAALLGDLGIRIRTLADFPTAPEVEEDGETCEANARKKAREIAAVTGLLSVADDTGLEVDALGGRPGVFAARYAGEGDADCARAGRGAVGGLGGRVIKTTLSPIHPIRP